ncbi:MAG TPA: A/G-specific adenine glycosylase [Candidatus Krumholzibacteria bacterium]|nr:A/G-specific adenine glycosylase [Candidatus Krumholzibacteria bacterium]HRX51700.1 A/G-specific adenine glycosylase [Candidatus Krumholzibacteria bacterium]
MTPRSDPSLDLLEGLDLGALRRDLLSWYRRRGRSLPWREDPGVYGIWISEIMLQQTTVTAVIPRWREFLARFPDVAALAAADEAQVLDAWRGLGYYRRARQLHMAAKEIMAAGEARFPDSAAGWRALPGVGDYTAGAVASIGLGLPEAAVDTNVDRVLRRLLCDRPGDAADLKPAALRALAAALVDPADPGAWTQALMDLGAGPCRVADPDCGGCPLAAHCRSRAAGNAALIPPRAPRPDIVPVVLSLLVVRDRRGLLAVPPGSEPALRPAAWGGEARSDYAGLYRGYWRLPATGWYPAASAPGTAAMVRAWADWLGADPEAVHPVGAFRGTVTRYRQEVRVVAAVQDVIWPQPPRAEPIPLHDAARPLAQPDRRALELAEKSPI